MKRIVDEPACALFERTCEALAAPSVDPAEEATLRAHAAECAECAGVLRAAFELRRTRIEADVPEPGEAYWAGFSRRLDARLGSAARNGPGYFGRRGSGALRAALAAAAAVALVAGGLAVRHARRAAETARPVAEAELLEELDRAPRERVVEILDEIAPTELDDAAEELAEAGDLLHDAGAPDADDGPDANDPFLGLGDEDRDFLLEETLGEIG